ncbi:MAG: hypothetical protein ACI87E_000040 [Mariniblastus sp.]|jgi:hypothetical protein
MPRVPGLLFADIHKDRFLSLVILTEPIKRFKFQNVNFSLLILRMVLGGMTD